MLTVIDCKARVADHRLGAENGCQVLGSISQSAATRLGILGDGLATVMA